MRVLEEREKEGLRQRLTWWEDNQIGEDGGWCEIEGMEDMERSGWCGVLWGKQEEWWWTSVIQLNNGEYVLEISKISLAICWKIASTLLWAKMHKCTFKMSISSVKYSIPINVQTNQKQIIYSKINLCEVFSSKRVEMIGKVYQFGIVHLFNPRLCMTNLSSKQRILV